MPETLDSRALRAVSDAVVTIAREHRFEPVLEKLADAARELVAARYAAIGVPDGAGGFSHFITSGMSQKQYDAIGDLPRQHGLLGAMLETPRSQRFPNIQEHPRFEGWPDAHPSMRSFLGVPIVSAGEVIGAFYLTDKKGERGALFDDADQELIETLAGHAAVAIQNARLYERSRELTVVEERNRLARELHDAVNQTLFSVSLTADAAALPVDSDPERAKQQLAEMRSLIFELRPGDVGSDGLAVTLQKHVDVLRRVHGVDIELSLDGVEVEPQLEREVFRVTQEAIGNALKHAAPEHVRVEARRDGRRLFVDVLPDVEVVGEAEDGAAAIQQARELGPDVVVMDVVMPQVDGVEATKALRAEAPGVKVLALSTFGDEDHVLPTLAAGASGFLTKDTRPDEIAEAIRTVNRGDPVLCAEATRRVLRRVHAGRDRPEGTVTVRFTDIVDSTPLVDRIGDERAREVFKEHDRLVREALEQTGGVEVEREGDKFMLAFASARAALRRAVEIQRALAENDIGVSGGAGANTGDVIAEERGYFGRP